MFPFRRPMSPAMTWAIPPKKIAIARTAPPPIQVPTWSPARMVVMPNPSNPKVAGLAHHSGFSSTFGGASISPRAVSIVCPATDMLSRRMISKYINPGRPRSTPGPSFVDRGRSGFPASGSPAESAPARHSYAAWGLERRGHGRPKRALAHRLRQDLGDPDPRPHRDEPEPGRRVAGTGHRKARQLHAEGRLPPRHGRDQLARLRYRGRQDGGPDRGRPAEGHPPAAHHGCRVAALERSDRRRAVREG